jgi:8-oxo-dGTP pyrophosphatase MutT (NUDIX family)
MAPQPGSTPAKVAPQRPVPVVRLVVPGPAGRVLLLQRARTAYGEGAWCLPGGKVDYGVTVETTVGRELFEETSLQCLSSRFLFYQDSLPAEPGVMHCLNLYFECQAAGEIRLNEESSDFAWVGKAELRAFQIVFKNDEALARYWAG